MNIGICDDQKIMAELIRKSIEQFFQNEGIEYRIYMYSNGKQVVESDVEHSLLFMDIDMPEMDGMSAAFELQSRNKLESTELVFVTSHQEEVRKAFKVKAFRFLVKDSFEEEIQECLEAYIKEQKSKKKYIVELEGIEVEILSGDIIFISARPNGTEVWAKSNVYTSKKTLDNWEEELEPALFIRSHKANIINLSHIDYVEDYVMMDSGDKVKISRRNRSEVIKRYNQYIYENAN